MLFKKKTTMPDADGALDDRSAVIEPTSPHFVLDTPMTPPFPNGTEVVYLGMGCFWGAERLYWQVPGVYTTAVGYSGGFTKNPTYEDVCSARTGHAEVVLVAYDPDRIGFEELMRLFWEEHDPTQGMRQGPDAGTQYRSTVYWTTEEQRRIAEATRASYQERLGASGFGRITTEISKAGPFFYAEAYHQQYHARNLARAGGDVRNFYLGDDPAPKRPMPHEGYCGMEPTGVSCPIGLGVDSEPPAT